MQGLTYAYVASTNLVRDRIETLRKNDRGQGTLEYLGLLILVAAIVTVVITQTTLGNDIKKAVNSTVQSVLDLAPKNG